MLFVEPEVDYFRIHLDGISLPPLVLANEATADARDGLARASAPPTDAAPSPPPTTATDDGLVGGTSMEERVDAVHRALLASYFDRVPYEDRRTLENVHVLVITHCAPPSITAQPLTVEEIAELTAHHQFLPSELRFRTFTSHLHSALDPSPSLDEAEKKPEQPQPLGEQLPPSHSPPPDTAPKPADESWKHEMGSLIPKYYDSLYLMLQNLTEAQQERYLECSSGRGGHSAARPSLDGVARASTTSPLEVPPREVTFRVAEGSFIHYVLAPEEDPHLQEGMTTVVGESRSIPLGEAAKEAEKKAEKQRSREAARMLYFSVYQIPLHHFSSEEQTFYAQQRERLRAAQFRARTLQAESNVAGSPGTPSTWMGEPIQEAFLSELPQADRERQEEAQRQFFYRCHQILSNHVVMQLDEEKVEAGSGSSRPSATDAAPAQIAAVPPPQTQPEVVAAAEGPKQTDSVKPKRGPPARLLQRLMQKTKPAATTNEEEKPTTLPTPSVPVPESNAASPAAAIGNEMKTNSDQTPPAPPQRTTVRLPFPGVRWSGVRRLLYSLSPCDCYHMVMKDNNPLYSAASHQSAYAPQTISLSLISDLTLPETRSRVTSTLTPRATMGAAAGVNTPATVFARCSCRSTRVSSLRATQLRQTASSEGQPPSRQSPDPIAAGGVPLWFRTEADTGNAAPPLATQQPSWGIDGLVASHRATRLPSPERPSLSNRHTAGAEYAPPVVSPQTSCVSRREGTLQVSVSLCCNGISGNPQPTPRSLLEKGARLPAFLGGGGPTVVPSGRECESPEAVNLFHALAKSSLAQHKLRVGSIRPVVSMAVLEYRHGGVVGDDGADASPLSFLRQTSEESTRHTCRALLDHTWFALPVQLTPSSQDSIQWMPLVFGSTECASNAGDRTAVHVGFFSRPQAPTPDQPIDTGAVLPTKGAVQASLRPVSPPLQQRETNTLDAQINTSEGVTATKPTPPAATAATDENSGRGGVAMTFDFTPRPTDAASTPPPRTRATQIRATRGDTPIRGFSTSAAPANSWDDVPVGGNRAARPPGNSWDDVPVGGNRTARPPGNSWDDVPVGGNRAARPPANSWDDVPVGGNRAARPPGNSWDDVPVGGNRAARPPANSWDDVPVGGNRAARPPGNSWDDVPVGGNRAARPPANSWDDVPVGGNRAARPPGNSWDDVPVGGNRAARPPANSWDDVPVGGNRAARPPGNSWDDVPVGGNRAARPPGNNWDDVPVGGNRAARPPGNSWDDVPVGGNRAARPPGNSWDDVPVGGNRAARPPGNNWDDVPVGGNRAARPPANSWDDVPVGGNRAARPPGNSWDDVPVGGNRAARPPGNSWDDVPVGGNRAARPPANSWDDVPVGGNRAARPPANSWDDVPVGGNRAARPPGNSWDDVPVGGNRAARPPANSWDDVPVGGNRAARPPANSWDDVPVGGNRAARPPGNNWDDVPVGGSNVGRGLFGGTPRKNVSWEGVTACGTRRCPEAIDREEDACNQTSLGFGQGMWNDAVSCSPPCGQRWPSSTMPRGGGVGPMSSSVGGSTNGGPVYQNPFASLQTPSRRPSRSAYAGSPLPGPAHASGALRGSIHRPSNGWNAVGGGGPVGGNFGSTRLSISPQSNIGTSGFGRPSGDQHHRMAMGYPRMSMAPPERFSNNFPTGSSQAVGPSHPPFGRPTHSVSRAAAVPPLSRGPYAYADQGRTPASLGGGNDPIYIDEYNDYGRLTATGGRLRPRGTQAMDPVWARPVPSMSAARNLRSSATTRPAPLRSRVAGLSWSRPPRPTTFRPSVAAPRGLPPLGARRPTTTSVRERLEARAKATKCARVSAYDNNLQENYLMGADTKRYRYEAWGGTSTSPKPIFAAAPTTGGSQCTAAAVQAVSEAQRKLDAEALARSLGLKDRDVPLSTEEVLVEADRLNRYASEAAALRGLSDASSEASGVNLSWTLRDLAEAFASMPQHLPQEDVCHAAWAAPGGMSCFLSRPPNALRGGWQSYLERLNLYQEPFYLRHSAFIFVMRVPHAPHLRVCLAVHNINDFLAVLQQRALPRIWPTPEEQWLRQRNFAADLDAEFLRQCDAGETVSRDRGLTAELTEYTERRWLFGLFSSRTTRVPAVGTASQTSSEEDWRQMLRVCYRRKRQFQADGLRVSWWHRLALLWHKTKTTLQSVGANDATSPLLTNPLAFKARASLLSDRLAAYAAVRHRIVTLQKVRHAYIARRADELTRDRVAKICAKAHREEGIQLGVERSTVPRVAQHSSLSASIAARRAELRRGTVAAAPSAMGPTASRQAAGGVAMTFDATPTPPPTAETPETRVRSGGVAMTFDATPTPASTRGLPQTRVRSGGVAMTFDASPLVDRRTPVARATSRFSSSNSLATPPWRSSTPPPSTQRIWPPPRPTAAPAWRHAYQTQRQPQEVRLPHRMNLSSGISPYYVGTGISPVKDNQKDAERAKQEQDRLDVLLRLHREDGLAEALSKVEALRARSIQPPLTTVLSLVARGPDERPATVGSEGDQLYAGFIPTPLEIHRQLENHHVTVSQVQQLLLWQWEYHQTRYELVPLPVFRASVVPSVRGSGGMFSALGGGGEVNQDPATANVWAGSRSELRVSPLARTLLQHLAKWSWLIPVDVHALREDGELLLHTSDFYDVAHLLQKRVGWLLVALTAASWCQPMMTVTVALGCLALYFVLVGVVGMAGGNGVGRLFSGSQKRRDTIAAVNTFSWLYQQMEHPAAVLLERGRDFTEQARITRVLQVQSILCGLLSRAFYCVCGRSPILSLMMAVMCVFHVGLLFIYWGIMEDARRSWSMVEQCLMAAVAPLVTSTRFLVEWVHGLLERFTAAPPADAVRSATHFVQNGQAFSYGDGFDLRVPSESSVETSGASLGSLVMQRVLEFLWQVALQTRAAAADAAETHALLPALLFLYALATLLPKSPLGAMWRYMWMLFINDDALTHQPILF